jgi:hypothetical protein
MPDDPKLEPADAHLMAPAPRAPLAATGAAPAINVAQVLEAAVRGGVNAENVAVVKELVGLQERMEAREAEKAFARAFNALQSEMPAIQAQRPVKNNDGSLRYKFAPYEDIMEQVRPLLLKHGFTVSFSLSFSEGRVTQKCTLTHLDGHSRSNEYSVRIGKGPPGSSESQADGAAGTYAKRHALCDALNIVIEKDSDGIPSDARDIGAPISKDKIQYLREQLAEAGGTEDGLLKLAGVTKMEEIGEAVYPVLVRALELRKKSKK